MTLIFPTSSNKPDTRKIDYEKSMVRLGLETAELQQQADRVRNEIADLNLSRDNATRSRDAVLDEVKNLERRAVDVRQEISDAIQKGSNDVSALRDKSKTTGEALDDKNSELEKLKLYLEALGEQIVEKNKNLSDLESQERVAMTEFSNVQMQIAGAKRELDDIRGDVQSMFRLKVEVTDALNSARAERQEIEGIVSVLKENNKEGLELTASFDGERKRLREKEDFLTRKEADLAIYENRLAKRCAEVGYNPNMKFI